MPIQSVLVRDETKKGKGSSQVSNTSRMRINCSIFPSNFLQQPSQNLGGVPAMDRNLMLCSPHVALRIPRFLLAAGVADPGRKEGRFLPPGW